MTAPLLAPTVRLAPFLATVEPLGPAGQRDLMRAEVAAHGGDLDHPMDGSGYALSLHGIHVVGISEADAIRQWRCLARTTLGGWDTPTDDPALRAAQIDWASWVMGQRGPLALRHLTNASRIIRALSNNAILLDRARELTARHALPA